MWSTHVPEKHTMLYLKDSKFLFMLLVFKYKTKKESFFWETEIALKIIRGTAVCLKRRNILVKGNAWVMFTIYWLFMNAKKTIWQGFEINVWSHFAYVLYWTKNFFYSNRATISFIIFWDFSMFYQTFLPPQVKRWATITYKHGIYELPHELLKNIYLILVVKESTHNYSSFSWTLNVPFFHNDFSNHVLLLMSDSASCSHSS